jgi:hypothetical protein
MNRRKQSFRNRTNRPQFINLELSTARFRLDPGEELVLFYDGGRIEDGSSSSPKIEFISGLDGVELVVWTEEDEMFLADGRPAPQNFDRV